MQSLYENSELADLIIKVKRAERLSYEDGVRLFRSNDLITIGYMADIVRQAKHHRLAYITSWSKVQLESCALAKLAYDELATPEARVDFLISLRSQQDQTQAVKGVYPLWEEDNTSELESSTGFDDLKVLAIARILLDNVEHIVVSTKILGSKLTQVALDFGADMLADDSTELSEQELIQMIEKAGKHPVKVDF